MSVDHSGLLKQTKNKEYGKFIKGIVKSIEYQKVEQNCSPFLGSQPIQVSKSIGNHLIGPEMFMSPKLDGVRYLLFINSKGLLFINRPGHQFSLSHKIANIKTREKYILDCELYFHDNGTLTIFVFDYLLFSNGNQIFKIYKDQFDKRYTKVHQLFQTSGVIRKYIDELLKKGIYLVPKIFYRRTDVVSDSYETLCDNFRSNYPLSGGLTFDGVIFNNPYYRYYLFPQLGYGQYKWKPKDDITVDMTFKEGNLLDRQGNEWKRVSKFTSAGSTMVDGKAYEFKIISVIDGKLILKRIDEKGTREKGANAFLTLESTYEAYVDYIDYKEIINALELLVNPVNSSGYNWLNKNKAIQMGLLEFRKELVTEDEIEKIRQKMIPFYLDMVTRNKGVSKNTKQAGNMVHRLIDSEIKLEKKELIDERRKLQERLQEIKDTEEIDEEIEKIKEEIEKIEEELAEIEEKIINKIFSYDVMKIQDEYNPITFRMTLDFNRPLEVGFKKFRKPTPEQLIQRGRNISLKNIDVRKLKLLLDRQIKKISHYKELEIITKFKTKQGSLMSEKFTYDYQKTNPDSSKYRLKEYTNKVEMQSEVKIEFIEEIFDYSVKVNFQVDKVENITSDHQQRLSMSPKIIANKWREIYRNVHEYKLTPFITIKIVFVKEFTLRPKRDQNGNIIKLPDGNPEMEWEKYPLRKSFIDVGVDFRKIIEEIGRVEHFYENVKIRNHMVKKKLKPLIKNPKNVSETLYNQLNILLDFIFTGICF